MDQFKLVLVDLKGGVWWETVPACLKVLLSATEGVMNEGLSWCSDAKASEQSSRTIVEDRFSLVSFTGAFRCSGPLVKGGASE